jgi:hypothetical protein
MTIATRTSPTGRVFSDPTDALRYAVMNCRRVQHHWCPRPGDLDEHVRICEQWCGKHARSKPASPPANP